MAIPSDVEKNRQAILNSSSYLMAEVDIEFLGRGEQRPVLGGDLKLIPLGAGETIEIEARPARKVDAGSL